jgi:hypothetical protein
MQSQLKNILITSHKEGMIAFLKSCPEYFNEALDLAISDDQPFAWRSAFLISSCMKENDERVKNYVKPILACLKTKSDGHQRDLLRVLYKMKLSDRNEGTLFDVCIRLWEQIGKAPSVRMMAFKFIIKIVKQHPELLNEISALMQDHYLQSLSPGIKNSVNRMMQEFVEQE